MSLVAIVGRPNVGKSTLFNRLVGMRQAIVDETAGVTRDRHYGKSEWCGHEFSVVDTGGYTSNSDDVFEAEIRKQVILAIEEADLILFMVEAQTGITDYDAEIADILRRSNKPVVVAVNKVDTGDKMYDSYQFYSLGLGDRLFSISSATGGGTGDLLDEIVRLLPPDSGWSSECRKILPDERSPRNRAQHSDSRSGDNPGLHLHILQQVRTRVHDGGHRRDEEEVKGT